MKHKSIHTKNPTVIGDLFHLIFSRGMDISKPESMTYVFWFIAIYKWVWQWKCALISAGIEKFLVEQSKPIQSNE